MKIKRISKKFVTLCMLLLTLVACSDSASSTTKDYVKSFEKPYSNIFQMISEGKYGDAEEIIEEKIIGDSIKEEEAKGIVKEFYQLLVDQFNGETLTYDEFVFIHENLCKTKFCDYVDYESLERLQIISDSKYSYRQGNNYFASGNYADAVGSLSNVSALDSNFPAAIDMISEIAAAWGDSEDLQELKEAVFACDIINDRRSAARENNDGSLSVLVRDNIIADESMIEIKLRFAQRLEEQKQYRYAIQQYAQLIVDYDYLQWADLEAGVGGDTQACEGYRRLMCMLNSKCYTDHGYYYIGEFDPDGYLLRGDNAGWMIKSWGVYQVADWYAGSDEEILIKIYRPTPSDSSFDTDPLWTRAQAWNRYGNNPSDAVTALAEKIEQTAGIIKVVTGYDGIAALLYDGTVRRFSLENTYNEVEGWYQIIDLFALSDGFIGLTDDGRIVATSKLTDKYPALAAALAWEGVVSVSFGCETDGFSWRIPLYALCGDGTIKYIKDFFENPSSGEFQANAIAIAGNYYLDSEGSLHTFLDSLQPEVDKWSPAKFADIISPCGRYYSSSNSTVTVYDISGKVDFELPNIAES